MGQLSAGYTDPSLKNALFLTPNQKVIREVGFRAVPRGRNTLAKLLSNAMKRIGVKGKFTNTQVRSIHISKALESGLGDNQIIAGTGHINPEGLKPYKNPSLA